MGSCKASIGLWLLLFALLPCQAQNNVALTAEQVKAAFLYNFTKYTEWPPVADGEPGVLHICVLQAGDVAAELERSIDGKMSGTRTIRIRRLKDAADVGRCELVFVDNGSRQDEQKLASAASTQPVLTVGDSEGWMIRFVVEGDRVRFDINVAAARKVNIRFDSRLLALARIRIEVLR